MSATIFTSIGNYFFPVPEAKKSVRSFRYVPSSYIRSLSPQMLSPSSLMRLEMETESAEKNGNGLIINVNKLDQMMHGAPRLQNKIQGQPRRVNNAVNLDHKTHDCSI